MIDLEKYKKQMSFNTKRIQQLFIIVFFIFSAQSASAMYGRNEIGLKVGAFFPQDYEAYFPIQSDVIHEYVSYNSAIISIFYLRHVNSSLDMGIDLGFTGVVDPVDENTILNSWPINVYALKQLIRLYGVEWYFGAGLNTWIMENQEGELTATNGGHFKTEFRYLFAKLEINYSRIDHFESNALDLGGWSIKIGVSHRFSYY